MCAEENVVSVRKANCYTAPDKPQIDMKTENTLRDSTSQIDSEDERSMKGC